MRGAKKIVITSIVFLVALLSNRTMMYSQIKLDTSKMATEIFKFNKRVQIKMNEEVHFEDSLTVLLTSFSHKRPYVGGPTKATAYLTVFNGALSESIMLSFHGTEGKSDIESFDTLIWKEYTFELKKFDYDTAVEVIVSKTK